MSRFPSGVSTVHGLVTADYSAPRDCARSSSSGTFLEGGRPHSSRVDERASRWRTTMRRREVAAISDLLFPLFRRFQRPLHEAELVPERILHDRPLQVRRIVGRVQSGWLDG